MRNIRGSHFNEANKACHRSDSEKIREYKVRIRLVEMIFTKYIPFTQEEMDSLRKKQKGQGSFHSTLIDLWFLADDYNKQKLEIAYPKFLSR